MDAKSIGHAVAESTTTAALVTSEYVVLSAQVTTTGTKSFFTGLSEGFAAAKLRAQKRRAEREAASSAVVSAS